MELLSAIFASLAQGRTLVTNFYTPRFAAIFSQFMQQLNKLTGMRSRMNLGQTRSGTIL